MLSLTENKYAILAKKSEAERNTINLNGKVRKLRNNIQVRIINDEPTKDNDAVTIPICFKTRY